MLSESCNLCADILIYVTYYIFERNIAAILKKLSMGGPHLNMFMIASGASESVSLKIIWKNGSFRNRENLQYYKTADSVLLSLFMRANGKCNNSHAPSTGLVGFIECISARFIFYHSILLLYYSYVPKHKNKIVCILFILSTS